MIGDSQAYSLIHTETARKHLSIHLSSHDLFGTSGVRDLVDRTDSDHSP